MVSQTISVLWETKIKPGAFRLLCMTRSHSRWRDCFVVIPWVSHSFEFCSHLQPPITFSHGAWKKPTAHSKGHVLILQACMALACSVGGRCRALPHWASSDANREDQPMFPHHLKQVRNPLLQQWLNMLLVLCAGSNSNQVSSSTVLIVRQGHAHASRTQGSLFFLLSRALGASWCFSFLSLIVLCFKPAHFFFPT